MPLDPGSLRSLPLPELLQTARQLSVENASSMRRQELVAAILRESGGSSNDGGEGVLEILPDGFGFLRAPEYAFAPGADDIYVSPSQIRRFNLRTGDVVRGQVRAPKENERYFALIKVEAVNGENPEAVRDKVLFDNLVPVRPTRHLEIATDTVDTKLIEAVAPLRFGQRVAIVAGPRTGRTTLLTEIAQGLHQHHPKLSVLAVAVAERPEDVTELQRLIPGEVAATTFDEGDVRHLQVADMGIERAKRRVERREDVVVLLDSASRLVRAAAGAVAPSGRAVGGVDVAALHRIKRLLAAGRAVEEGGSLTLIYVVDPNDAFASELLGLETARIVLDPERAAAFRWPTIDPLRSWSAGTETTIDPATRARLATDEGVDALRR